MIFFLVSYQHFTSWLGLQTVLESHLWCLLQAILESESSELPFPFIVDVRNIAEAHIAAAVTPSAKGRYLVSNANTVPNCQVIAILEERFPGLQFQKAKQEDSKPVLVNDKVCLLCCPFVSTVLLSSW